MTLSADRRSLTEQRLTPIADASGFCSSVDRSAVLHDESFALLHTEDAIEFVDKLGVILSDASDGRITTVRYSNQRAVRRSSWTQNPGLLSHVSDCTPGPPAPSRTRTSSVNEVQSDTRDVLDPELRSEFDGRRFPALVTHPWVSFWAVDEEHAVPA